MCVGALCELGLRRNVFPRWDNEDCVNAKKHTLCELEPGFGIKARTAAKIGVLRDSNPGTQAGGSKVLRVIPLR